MAARSLRPGAALAIAGIVAGLLAVSLLSRGRTSSSLWPARAESWFGDKTGPAFYLDEPAQH